MTFDKTNHVWLDGRVLNINVTPDNILDENGLLDYTEFAAFLADKDVIFCNEINPPENPFDMLLSGTKYIYYFTQEDLDRLKEKGEVALQYQGHPNDFIDMSNPEHIAFYKWLNY